MIDSKILISKEEIINLLNKSFEEGYGGYLELKEDCVASILDSYLHSQQETQKKLCENSYQISLSSSEIGLPNYETSGHIFLNSENLNTTSSQIVDNSGQLTLSLNY